MLKIGELSERAGLPAQTVRYYERVGLLPKPERAPNGYRLYHQQDVQRLNFIRSARALDFSLDDIQEILDLRDRGSAPCRVVMGLMARQIEAIDDRIRELERLRAELTRLHKAGLGMPDDVRMKACVCHLIESGSDATPDLIAPE
ncbi:MAG TPA: heavy metal-responsive transcriptional regulator [Anaerolineales bacterium]|nr:heavy metal-responsive transcriptional regulator [Anaerolineales bacterium]